MFGGDAQPSLLRPRLSSIVPVDVQEAEKADGMECVCFHQGRGRLCAKPLQRSRHPAKGGSFNEIGGVFFAVGALSLAKWNFSFPSLNPLFRH